jgi:hypothetical protein
MSTFKIIKKGANNFWHWFNNDAKKVAISDFEVVLDEVSQTFVIVYKNGANVPNQSVNVLNIEVIDETDTSAIETFTNVVDLRSRLVQLGYTPYLSGIGILSVVAGTNVSIDNTDPANPIISASSGDLQNVTDIGNTTTNPILIPELQLYDTATDAYAKISYLDGQFDFRDINGRIIKVIEKDGLEQTININDFYLTKEISSLTANRQRIEPNKDGTYAMLDDILPSAWKEPAELLLLNADVVQGGGLPQISGLIIQGHTLVQGSRVVVTEYNIPAFNGIYRVGSGPIIGTGNYLLVRTNDANSTTELNNAVIGITNGTFSGKTYRQTTANPVINTTTINFVEFAPTITIDATPTDGSSNAVSSNGVFDALATKVDKVTGSRLITSAESTLLGNTSGTNSGDNATNTTSNAYADAKVTDAIVNGVTTIAPSQNAVFDALDLKQNNLTETNFGTFSNSLTDKNTLIDADQVVSVDSADSNKAKKTSWLNVWNNFIKSKTDNLYATIANLALKLNIASPSYTGLMTGVGTTQTGNSAIGVVDLSQTWNTTGIPTAIRLNVTDTASATNTSMLMDLRVGNVSRFTINKNGRISFGAFGSTPSIYADNNGILFTNFAANNQTGYSFGNGQGTIVSTFGTTNGVRIGAAGNVGFSVSSGTAIYNSLFINEVINQTGTANGITRGLFINPTLTSAADFRAIEVTAGSIVLPYATASSTYAIRNQDYLVNFTTGTFTATLPTAVGCAGKEYRLKNSGTGVITISTTSSQTIDGATTYSLASQWKYVSVVSTGSNWIVIANN